tara:strand:+ start:536 stop:919 length:384 start_codon:yes stop_codon:yes gene_type:complete
MGKVILDTNFILSCVKQKIDFLEDIKLMGMEILIPKQVINELKIISKSKKKLHFREQSELALKLLEKNRKSWVKKDLSNYGKNTDKGIINFGNKNKSIIIATLDKELKNKIKNQKLVIRGKKNLEIT